mmetsp:Transcript_38597/g.90238  ORF Transcript_38597/g.90238 Transcript_38597/m.90238 type:complete len:465 (-) Transcript_38597:1410-2804(-)
MCSITKCICIDHKAPNCYVLLTSQASGDGQRCTSTSLAHGSASVLAAQPAATARRRGTPLRRATPVAALGSRHGASSGRQRRCRSATRAAPLSTATPPRPPHAAWRGCPGRRSDPDLGKIFEELPGEVVLGEVSDALVLVAVEVRVVRRALDLGHVRRGQLLRVELLPVEAFEPLVVAHVERAVLEGAEPARRVDTEQRVDETPRRRLDRVWPRHLALDDLAVALHRVVGDEGRRAGEALESEDPDAPPVGAEAVALVEDDLGGEVLRGAAQGPRAVGDDLGEAEIDHLEVALLVDEQVLGLEVAVDDFEAVHVREDRHDLRRVEARVLVGQRRLGGEQREELAAERNLEQHVELALVLVCGDELQDEGVVHHREDLLLVHHVLLLLHLDHLGLAHALERVGLDRRLVHHQLDAAEGAHAEDAPQLEVLPRGRARLLRLQVAPLDLRVDERLQRAEDRGEGLPI